MNKLQVIQTEIRSKNTFSYQTFNFSNCNVTSNQFIRKCSIST